MKKLLLFISAVLTFLSCGCAGNQAFIEGPFTQYTHETFIKEDTGETGLYINNETWYALVDLHGFKSTDMGIRASDEFLNRKNQQGITLAVSAEKIDSVTDDTSCRKGIYQKLPYRHSTEVEIRDIGKRRVLIHPGRKKMINYCPYYKGYCFDFQFSMSKDLPDSAIQGILDSIVFVEDNTIRSKVQKVFCIYDKKLQLSIPEKWKYTFVAGVLHTPGILFTPVEGSSFQIYLSPLSGFDGDSPSVAKAREFVDRRVNKWESKSGFRPVMQDYPNDKITISYFEVTDKEAHEDDPAEYTSQRHGYAVLDGAIMYFSMLFREEGREDVLKAFDILVQSKVMDIDTELVIPFASEVKKGS